MCNVCSIMKMSIFLTLKDLRDLSHEYEEKQKAKRGKLAKRYELKILTKLTYKTITTGKISAYVTVPTIIKQEIMDLFDDKGFDVTFISYRNNYKKTELLIEDKGEI